MTKALDVLSSLVLDDDRLWAESASYWQWEDAHSVLEPGDGPRFHFLTRPRGGSKTTDLGAMAVAALLTQLPAASRSYWVAADRDQGRLGVDAMAGLILRSGLSSKLKADQWKVTAPNGATLEVLAADGPGAMGLKSPFVVVDELAAWPTGETHRKVWNGIHSGMGKVPGARLVILTNAGDPTSMAAKVRDHALTSRLWNVHEVPGPLPWASEDFLEDQRSLLLDSEFARLHLNTWLAGEDRLVSAADVQRAAVLSGPLPPEPGVLYRVGADVGISNDRSVVCVTHAELAGEAIAGQGRIQRRRVVLDRIVRFKGSKTDRVVMDRVEETIYSLSRAYNGAKVRMDPAWAESIIQNVERRGVIVERWAYSDKRYAHGATTLFTLLRDGLLHLPEDEVLLDELLTVRLRPTRSGALRADHDKGRHDDQVQALQFSVTSLLETVGWSKRMPLTAVELEMRRRQQWDAAHSAPVSVAGDLAGRVF
jgi:phage terminase large subunit-like protein